MYKITTRALLVFLLLSISSIAMQARALTKQEEELMHAARMGHMQTVKTLIQTGVNVDVRDPNGNTPLINAIMSENLDVIRLLIEAGAYIRSEDVEYARLKGFDAAAGLLNEKHTTLRDQLIEGVQAGDISTVVKALKAGADVNNARDEDGVMALLYAIKNNHKDIAELLLRYGADVNAQSAKQNNGPTALMLASDRGHKDIVELLLKYGARVNIQDNYGSTALMCAAFQGHRDIVKLLSNHGVHINAQSRGGSRTALIVATSKGHKDVVALLLNAEADVNVQDNNGNTALWYAARHGYKDIVTMLINAGADINRGRRTTPLIEAIGGEHKDIVRILVNAGANVNLYTPLNTSPLMWAIDFTRKNCNDLKEIIAVLIKAGVDVNAPRCDGWTPLMNAIAYNYTYLVPLLLKVGARIDVMDDKGITPLTLAVLRRDVPLVIMLINAAPECCAKDKMALGQAKAKGYDELIYMLSTCANPQVQEYVKDTHNYISEYMIYHALERQHARTCTPKRSGILSYTYDHSVCKHQTVLMWACMFGHEHVVDALLACDLPEFFVQAKDTFGYTALLYAVMYGHAAIVDKLVRSGVRIPVQALKIAEQYGHREIMLKLLAALGVVPRVF